MTSEAASRIQSAGDRNPGGRTGRSGFGRRAQSAAAGNETSRTTGTDRRRRSR
ncbi:hypothetical protein [Frankia sp. ACN1ag]|uniref:hypothetical protein n=1 Tax=Frankia sp. ACN1ag TaxID=102891 RepID=UPI0037C12884